MNLSYDNELSERMSEIKRQQYLEEAANYQLVREAQGERVSLMRRIAWAMGRLLVSLAKWLLRGKEICDEVTEMQNPLEQSYS